MGEVIQAIVAVLTLAFGPGIAVRIVRALRKRKATQFPRTAPRADPLAERGSNQDGRDKTDGGREGKQKESITQDALSQTGFSDSVEKLEQERNIASALGKTGFDDTIRVIAGRPDTHRRR